MTNKWLVSIAVLATLLSGCGTNNGNGASPSPQNNDGLRQQAQQLPESAGEELDAAGRLEQLAKHVPGVENAHCVLLGDTAVVGIDVDASLDRSRVGTLKYSVAEALRDDPNGAKAIVTADMDLGERLREMRQDIQAGKPVAGFAEELADIVGRIVPQLPRDTLPRDTTDAPASPQVDQQL
ncbi:YhcN/YlaJ family sporulation lipoprotein [Paenibacillus sp. IB182496]|uniref:YhcN/YlaJ family sporulation lipoprotein n=1 Tax=Paenibacillus sabuli TaxID=2772509 RepID=A0A927BRY3_9BACL|nr:YhcN/YlaJ family sporulation lipoprotein [Paenibacillus sabuli]MBD2844419.1 YhcN/YlaJ family sporulation lipoprotein [Paenibacillus sabuli]